MSAYKGYDQYAPFDSWYTLAPLDIQFGIARTAVQSLELDFRRYIMAQPDEDAHLAFFLSRIQLLELAINAMSCPDPRRAGGES